MGTRQSIPCSCSDRHARARRRRSWSPLCSARRARWCRRRPNPTCCASPPSARGRHGPRLVYDPSGTVEMPSGVQRVQWSPVPGCMEWDDALLVARSLVGATRTGARRRDRGFDHWAERAEALLAPLLHAAALDGAELGAVLSWVDRRQGRGRARCARPQRRRCGRRPVGGHRRPPTHASRAGSGRRRQGCSRPTAVGPTLATTVAPDFDAAAFCDSAATLYICATGRHQAVAAPLVVGLLNEIRGAAYARAAAATSAISDRSSNPGPS